MTTKQLQKNSAKTPKLRFAGFSGAWEEKNLSGIGKTYNGLQGKSGEDFGEGEPFITYKQIFDSSEIDINQFAFVKITNGENQNKCQFGDVFFTTSSETPLEVGFASVLLNKNVSPYLNSFSFGFRFNSLNEYDPSFAKFFFRSFIYRKEVVKLAQGSTRYNISKTEFMKMKFAFPPLPEQTKIASFLELADGFIENLRIVKMLTDIAETKTIIDRAKLLPKQELKLRRQALIRMTHASTSIEGNQLNLRQVEAIVERKKIDAPARDIYEVENYLKAIRYISQVVEQKKPLSEKVILKIHKLVTDKTLPEEASGHYRKADIYVVRRRAGQRQEIIYTGPAAKKVSQLMADLMAWIHKSAEAEINPIIVAGIVHQEMAAIHPFRDGNGRTARALATLVVYQRGYDFRRLFALEDYYNKNRPNYYHAIDHGKNYETKKADLTGWLEYFVRGFKEEIAAIKTKVSSMSLMKADKNIESQVYLDKDQMMILDFLNQMGKVSMSDIVDILQCPKRTAQLRLQRLKKINMIKQIGKGRASGYVLS